MLLGVLSTRVVCQVNIKSHLGVLECHWLIVHLFSNRIDKRFHGPGFGRATHTMLEDNSGLGDFERSTIGCARKMPHRQCVAIISMNWDGLPSNVPPVEVGSELRIGFDFFLSLGLGAGDERSRTDCKSFTEHDVL